MFYHKIEERNVCVSEWTKSCEIEHERQNKLKMKGLSAILSGVCGTET